MSKLSSNAEEFLWNNFKFYLMTHKTCLCDNIMNIVNSSSDDPMTRYNDFTNELNNHFGLRSYVQGQSAQFSRFPYITVTIRVLDNGQCAARALMAFEVAFGVDTPNNGTGQTGYPGNSSEAIARFRSNICNSLDQIMYGAYDDDNKHYETRSFFEALADTSWVNPITKQGDPVAWKYNVIGRVDGENEVSDVVQLKREDRMSGALVFSVVYSMDLNNLYGNGVDCGC